MVDVIIVNWNSGEYIKKCIDSIFSNDNKNFINTNNNSKYISIYITLKIPSFNL